MSDAPEKDPTDDLAVLADEIDNEKPEVAPPPALTADEAIKRAEARLRAESGPLGLGGQPAPDLTRPARVRTTSRGNEPSPKVPQPGAPQPGADGIVDVDGDEMGAADPTLDISKYIEYLFYKCSSCGKTVFAGGADTKPTARCSFGCKTGVDGDGKAINGVMRLHRYRRERNPAPAE